MDSKKEEEKSPENIQSEPEKVIPVPKDFLKDQVPQNQQTPIPPPQSLTDAASYAQSTMGAINKNSLPQFGQKTPEPDAKEQKPTMEVHPVGFFSGRKIALILLIIFLLLVSSAAAALAYNNYELVKVPKIVTKTIDSLIIATPLPKNPRLILEKTQAEMLNVKTATVSTEITVSTKSPDFPVKEAKLMVKGPFEFTDKKTTKSQFDLSGSVKTEGLSVSAGGSVRIIDKYIYFRLSEFPGGSFLPMDSVKDKWFYIEVDEPQNKTEQEALNEKITKVTEILKNFATKSYKWTTKEETKDSFNLTIKPPKEDIDQLILDIFDVMETKKQTNIEKTLEKKNLEEFSDKLKNIELGMKVRKSDYLLTEARFKVSFEVEAPNLAAQSGISLSPNSVLPVDVQTTFAFSDYDKAVIVEIPEGAQNAKDYADEWMEDLQKSYGAFQEQNNTEQKNEKPQNNIRDLQDEQSPVLGDQNNIFELLFGTPGKSRSL